jgi:hypothetical protein
MSLTISGLICLRSLSASASICSMSSCLKVFCMLLPFCRITGFHFLKIYGSEADSREKQLRQPANIFLRLSRAHDQIHEPYTDSASFILDITWSCPVVTCCIAPPLAGPMLPAGFGSTPWSAQQQLSEFFVAGQIQPTTQSQRQTRAGITPLFS